ncbi:MAG: flagellar hook basal-body protein [Ignavibacteria bacterium]
MIKGIYYISRTLESKFKNIEIVSNNLANISTTGFKRELPFAELVARYSNQSIKQLTDYSQGNLLQTSNQLDLAINGKGFFAVQGKNGTEYTRNGRFKISEEGYLVNEQGNKVLGKKGEINLREFSSDQLQLLGISKKGEIKVGTSVVDELQISTVHDPSMLERKGGLNFDSTEESFHDANTEEFEIQQGWLEESNSNAITEMHSMIDINKDYETGQKMMNSLDTSLEKANEIGRV